MNNKELVEVRCPFIPQYRKIAGKLYPYNKLCNNLCAKVYPGSSGEGFCDSCKLTFEYQVDDQSESSTRVRVKSA